jgi:2-methylcitrate dehydratase PrpD
MRTPEQELAHFITHLRLGQVPPEAQRVLRLMVMAVSGTGIAGAGEDGVAALRDLLCEAGGSPQATTFVFGDKLPAHAAAQFNGTLCRALDYCDAMAPGPHIGAALFSAAMAAAELSGGCTGAEFMTALAAGAEVSSRLNLSEAQYDGLDPTEPRRRIAGGARRAGLGGRGRRRMRADGAARHHRTGQLSRRALWLRPPVRPGHARSA